MDTSVKASNTATLSLRDPAPMPVPALRTQPKPPAEEPKSFLHELYVASMFTLVFVVICCGVYPVAVWGIAFQAAYG